MVKYIVPRDSVLLYYYYHSHEQFKKPSFKTSPTKIVKSIKQDCAQMDILKWPIDIRCISGALNLYLCNTSICYYSRTLSTLLPFVKLALGEERK